jgi:hypothetical protein
VETGATAEPFRHRQTKGAETDTLGLTSTAPHSYSTVKPLRREGRMIPATPVVLPRAFLLHAGHGCGGHPAFPAPSLFRGTRLRYQLGYGISSGHIAACERKLVCINVIMRQHRTRNDDPSIKQKPRGLDRRVLLFSS